MHELRGATAPLLSQRSCFPHWELSLQKKLRCFLNYCFSWLLFPNVCITQKIWVCPGLWYFWFIFLFRGIFFFYICPLSSHTKTHTKKRVWSDLWSYFSLRKENKNVERFWIPAITMKNICWSLCKHKFILPWAWLLIKIHILFSNKLNSYKFSIFFFSKKLFQLHFVPE